MARSGRLPKTYAALVALHVPRPLNDTVAYDNTVEIIDALAGHALNRDQEDYLEILSDLVESYEGEHLPAFPLVLGLKLLQFLLDEHGMTGDDLACLLKVDRSTAYKIIKGTRNLTTDHIRLLAGRFAVRADMFIYGTCRNRSPVLPSGAMAKHNLYVEKHPDGYAVLRPNAERASAIAPTQAKAIAIARQLNPGHSPDVERVRHTSGGKPDKWRKA